jgi:hypothetical protein
MPDEGWTVMAEAIDSKPGGEADSEESPPIFGSWTRFYVVVIINTVLVYLLLYLFSLYAAH